MNYIVSACADARQVLAVVRLCNSVAQTKAIRLTPETWKKLGHLHDHRGFLTTLPLPPEQGDDDLFNLSEDVTPEMIFHRIIKAYRIKQSKPEAYSIFQKITSQAPTDDGISQSQKDTWLEMVRANEPRSSKQLAFELRKAYKLNNKALTSCLLQLLRKHQGVVKVKQPKKKAPVEEKKFNRHDRRNMPKSTNPKLLAKLDLKQQHQNYQKALKTTKEGKSGYGVRPMWLPSAPSEGRKSGRNGMLTSKGFVKKSAMKPMKKKQRR